MIYLYDGINIEGNGGLNPSATFTSDPFPLVDTIDCVVTEERNGQFSLVLRYPINATNSSRIVPDAILMVTPRPNASVEPFRIYDIEQDITGVVTARAYHLVYDLDGLSIGMPSSVFSGKYGITAVLNQLSASGQFIMRCFEVASDGITSNASVDFGDAKWVTIWKAIGTICAAFNAEMKYTWDTSTNRCTITFCAARGTAKKTTISYGKNIVSLDRKLDYNGLYSRVAACWFGGGSFYQGHAYTGYTGRVRTLWIDVTDQFSTTPTVEQLDDAAQAYVDSHDWNPSSELSVSFVPFDESSEITYWTSAKVGSSVVGHATIGGMTVAPTILYLCDTATVDASFIGVTATAKCVKVEYDAISDKYNNVTVGTIQNDIVDTILKLEG